MARTLKPENKHVTRAELLRELALFARAIENAIAPYEARIAALEAKPAEP